MALSPKKHISIDLTSSFTKFEEIISHKEMISYNISPLLMIKSEKIEEEEFFESLDVSKMDIEEREERIIKFLEESNVVMSSPASKKDDYYRKVKEKVLEISFLPTKKCLSLDNSILLTRRKSLQKLSTDSTCLALESSNSYDEKANLSILTKSASNITSKKVLENESNIRKKSYFFKHIAEKDSYCNHKLDEVHSNKEINESIENILYFK